MKLFSIIILNILILVSCKETTIDVAPSGSNTATQNVILIIIDGPRFSDTWNKGGHPNIPHQSQLAKEGLFFDHFYNEGETFTLPGHVAITTGYYELVSNDGSELPSHPSIFQRYLSHTESPPDKAWIITSKQKLHALGDTKSIEWRNSYLPSLNVEDREDKETLEISLDILDHYAPNLIMIHFRGPDKNGHGNNWAGYIESIRETDAYVRILWQYIQASDHYKNKTALLVTTDHGRHLAGIGSGFVGHGDRCEGCRHSYLLALGPDLDSAKVVSSTYGQIDIAPTIASILNFPWTGEGHPIKELLITKK